MTDKEKYVLDHYLITKNGEIFSNLRTKKDYVRLKTHFDKDGYETVTVVCGNKGERQPFHIHRLVALKYIENPNNLPVTNHKNLIKTDNRVSNLEWCSISYNTQHGFDNCAYSNIKKVKITLSTGESYVFPTASHASRFFGYSNPSIISWFLSRNKIPNKGKLHNAIIEYTDEDVTTIERNLNTAIKV